MNPKAARRVVTAAAFIFIAMLGREAEAAAPESRPNVLLISLDTLGASHLGIYGYDRPTSPVIDRLAREGAVFDHASAAAPATPPSHMTLLTSSLMCVHGIDGTNAKVASPKDLPTLADLLHHAGYATAAFTEDGWVTAALGFDRGFDVFVENRSPDLRAPTGQAEKTFGDALAWIQSEKAAPWFVFVHTYQVHHPYSPPDELVRLVAPDHGSDRASTDRALYDAEIRYTDGLLGTLVDGAEKASGSRPVLLVLVSDHGEAFGEHGQFFHGFSLYEELLHVPLVIRSPGHVAAQRVGDRVGLIDVAPTVLDLVGLPVPPQFQGRSLAPLLRGEHLPARATFAELAVLKKLAVYSGDTKRIIDLESHDAEVYDLAHDSHESHPIQRGPADAETLELVTAYEALCRTASQAPTAERELSPDVKKKLHALGYLDESK